jgi:hypothetical protein
MADTKLLTELAHAYIYGITTTNKAALDSLYKSRDREFPEEKKLELRLSDAFDKLIEWSDLRETSLMKPFMMYSLVLAIMHVTNPVSTLEGVYGSPKIAKLDRASAIANLTTLADAVDNPDDYPRFKEFVAASSEKTNVAAQRKTRFVFFSRALSQKRL